MKVSLIRSRLPGATLSYIVLLVAIFMLHRGEAVIGQDRVDSATTIDELWQRDQARLSEVVERLKQHIKRLQSLQEKRENWKHRVVAAETTAALNEVHAVSGDKLLKHEVSEKYLSGSFTNFTWMTVLEMLADKCGGKKVVIEAAPEMPVEPSQFPRLRVKSVLEILRDELHSRGYQLLLGSNQWVLAKRLPAEHPLLGSWELTRTYDKGKITDEYKSYSLLVTQENFLFIDDEAYVEEYSFAVSEDRLYFYNEAKEWVGNGSYQVNDNDAHVLFEYEPPADPTGDAAGSTYYLRLKRSVHKTEGD